MERFESEREFLENVMKAGASQRKRNLAIATDNKVLVEVCVNVNNFPYWNNVAYRRTLCRF